MAVILGGRYYSKSIGKINEATLKNMTEEQLERKRLEGDLKSKSEVICF